MHRIPIKALSVNECWQGRRFKTKKYKTYELQLRSMLPKIQVPPGPLSVSIEVGYSNRQADLDNCLKPLLDIFQKAYSFNDRHIMCITLSKVIVAKGNEFIKFAITKHVW